MGKEWAPPTPAGENWQKKAGFKMKVHKTSLEDISAVVGFNATLRLAAWFGDDSRRGVYVPAAVKDGMLLVRLIGRPAAQRLVTEWPGAYLSIPTLKDYDDDRRKRFIGRLLESGFSDREIAQRLRISERRVRQVCVELERYGLIEIVAPSAQKNAREKAQAKKAAEKAVEELLVPDPSLDAAFRTMKPRSKR